MKNVRRLLLLLPVIAFVAGCAGFQIPPGLLGAATVQPLLPKIEVGEVLLVRAPNNRALAAYYCVRTAPRFVCGLIGPVPRDGEMVFSFETYLDVKNDNPFPLPVVEALVAFTAFPAATGQRNVGAVCLSMCGDPAACAQGAAGACRSDRPQIRGIDDFGAATVGFLRAVVAGEAGLDNLRVKTIPPSGRTRVAVKLELAPELVLELVKTLGGGALAEVKQGRVPEFTIPYRIEGSVFMNIENFGRLAAPFGPFAGEWRLH